MNIQAMMKQAQKLQKDMLVAKEEINNTIFEGKSSFVTVNMNGNKEVKNIKIDTDKVEKEDILVTALNDAMKKVDEETERKMGKFTQGMPGLF